MVILAYVQKFFGTPLSWVWAGYTESISKNRLCKGKYNNNNNNFTVEKTDRYHFNPAAKVKSPVIRWIAVMCPWRDMTERALTSSSSFIHNPRPFMRKYQTNPGSGAFYKILTRDFPGGPVVKDLPFNAGEVDLNAGQGTKIPHASVQLKPTYHNYWSLRATTRKKPVHPSGAHMLQLRHDTAKNKK